MGIELIERAKSHDRRVALRAAGREHTYRDLLDASDRVAGALLREIGDTDLQERRVAFLVSPGFTYVATLWGIWRAGGIAVPLAVSHPPAELDHAVRDTEASALIAEADLLERVRDTAEALDIPLLTPPLEAKRSETLPVVAEQRRALIIFTSGTTSRPKGVVSTHANLRAQVHTLVDAWGWQPDDHILGVLPLHHVHGIVNVLTCALWTGARCTLHPRFDPKATWDAILSDDLTLFMAVPTIYSRLISVWEESDAQRQQQLSAACRRMRLMVSGSAALPVNVLEQWQRISGHILLERYGMTEIGMALANPLHCERRPGFVGSPLPGVSVRLVDENGASVPTGTPGEIEVRGDSVFMEYWRRPEETRAAFRDGWFRTGDVAVVEDGAYRILGRSSTDIIKTGGYKVSALEVEEVLRTHEAVQECAVVGVADADLGERVCAAIVRRAGHSVDAKELREWAKQHLAPYKVPSRVEMVNALPRNAMGKVLKPEVAKTFARG